MERPGYPTWTEWRSTPSHYSLPERRIAPSGKSRLLANSIPNPEISIASLVIPNPTRVGTLWKGSKSFWPPARGDAGLELAHYAGGPALKEAQSFTALAAAIDTSSPPSSLCRSVSPAARRATWFYSVRVLRQTASGRECWLSDNFPELGACQMATTLRAAIQRWTLRH
jgi:hypothetical protein